MIYKNNYITRQGYECLNVCISNYFSYQNIKISGSDIFFEGNGFLVEYSGDKTYPSIKAALYESNYIFLDKMKISYKHSLFEDSYNADLFLKNQIKNESHIAIRVSTDYLSYNKIYQQTQNSPHFINVIGYDELENKFYVSDGFVPTYNPDKYEGWMEYEELFNAWHHMNFEYIVLELNSRIIDYDKDLSIIKMKQGINRYLKTDNPIFRETIYGKRAIIELFQDLSEIFDNPKYNIKNIIFDINYQLKYHGFITSKMFTLQKIIEIGMDSVLCEQYKSLIEEWNKFCLLMLKIGISKNKNSFENLVKIVNEISLREEKILKDILNCLG